MKENSLGLLTTILPRLYQALAPTLASQAATRRRPTRGAVAD